MECSGSNFWPYMGFFPLMLCRMYQALLASGGHVSAKVMLNKIPKDDPHVRIVIQECQRTYIGHTSLKREKKRKKGKGVSGKIG